MNMEIVVAGETFYAEYVEDLRHVWSAVRSEEVKPAWITYDTETTGLHIKKDRPFLGAVCFNDKVYAFPMTKESTEPLRHITSYVGMTYGHNTNYDMHMTANITEDDNYPLKMGRYGDTMGLCRLVFEAISTRDGGDSLKLKAIGKKYIDPHADRFEKAVKSWLKQKVTMDRKFLTAMLRPHQWGIQRLEEAMNKGTEPIPDEVMHVFHTWRNNYPEPTYKDVPMEIMLPYVCVDTILTSLVVKKCLPVIAYKQQEHIMKREFDLLPVVYEMERHGIEVDREYLLESRDRMEEEIFNLTMRMHELAGREFTVGQHGLIKDIYEEKLGERPDSTDKQFLNRQKADGDELAGIISRLRRLEKWKETYIERVLQVSEYDGRFYTSMNQFNPVSGRFSGDAQQFPRDAIKDDEGNEIYNPRRAFKVRGYYLDFSQVELRVQAHFTLYYGGDTNLCRAYMPFKCTHYETGEIYSYTEYDQRNRWNEMKPGAPVNAVHWEKLLKDGWSVWLVPETGQPWIPTDVHMATTEKALRIMGFVPEEMPPADLAWWRSKGKTFNFMRNYGGGDKMAAETLEITLDQAKAMNRGYSDAFPVVVAYQRGVESTMQRYGFTVNMSGRRYYINDSRRFYKVGNYLIQGSCADDLKEKMLKISRFIKDNNLSIKMYLCVHDELQFDVPNPDEDWAIWEIKAIMENTPNVLVPIVVEVDFTETYWSDKRKVLSA